MGTEWQDGIDLQSFQTKDPQEILQWASNKFGARAALCCGFGVEGMVILDMLMKLKLDSVPIFTIDSGRLPQQTYELMDRVRMKYGVKIHVYFPDAAAVEEMVTEKGMNLFLESIEQRKRCCAVRKVAPLNRALAQLDGWIVGLRKSQSVTRAAVQKVSIDREHGGIAKISPLADWSHDQVWDYIHQHRVPYNKLHDQGYPSIGCACCTRAIEPGEDIRAGRWWWESPEHKECGLHAPQDKGAGI
ncbi:MAG TPA: phosphoadenylyl-sulfate reductase [Planctomycetota bacterium]|jgi:phosphoadenosine phosphosulfate reductase